MALSDDQRARAERVFELFDRHSKQDVLAFVPYVLMELTIAQPDIVLPPIAQELLADFARGLGITDAMPVEEAWKRIQHAFESNGALRALKTEFETFMREETVAASALDANVFATFLANKIVYQAPTEPPDGSVPAGPSARFALNKKV
ncbi:MAG: hypothetical protein H7Z43_01785 [Clostridia bacterium]|nr:hypothetical protein [Deltaproteobacteria bacterium]